MDHRVIVFIVFSLSKDCCRVIKLYNATVRHLADVASSDSLTSLSWPPAEFTKSDNQSGIGHIAVAVKNLLAFLVKSLHSI